MMKMKKILLYAAFIGAVTLSGGCDDFFNPDTDVTLDNDDYISEESEMYSGYIGIMTKMQAIGDKVIYLNELRGEMVVPTSTAPTELYNLYNYDDDLSGNSYADPAGFYEVINACNDYLRKLKTYKEKNSINESHYKALVSSTLRIKAWMFMTIAKIYGEVAWVDKPMTSLRDLSQFDILNLDETMVACKNLLDIGYDNIDGTYSTAWKDWVDPDTKEGESNYRPWDLMTPPYYALYAEICLWLGRYQQCIDLILDEMNSKYRISTNNSIAFLRNDDFLSSALNSTNNFFNTPFNSPNFNHEAVSAIMYNYNNRQTNSLLKHFDPVYPNKYWLAPAEVAVNRFKDNEFDPLKDRDSDPRMKNIVSEYNGKWVICKFRPTGSNANRQPYQDDVPIYTYRGADLYFMLAEAFNQLGRRAVVDALINRGVSAYISEFDVDAEGTYTGDWYGITPHWTNNSTIYDINGVPTKGSRKYGDRGIRGVEYNGMNIGARDFTSDRRHNDEEILKEMMLDMACEGKVYPAMIRMAKRYKDNSFMAKYVSEKYEATGNAETIRSKILNGDYFIKWKLK